MFAPRAVALLRVRAKIPGPRAMTVLSAKAVLSTDQRSALMRSVRREHTAPELEVRRFLHARGLRYSLHSPDLPGRPDIVLPRRHTVVFVHGCFWHGHDCRHGSVKSKRNAEYWGRKILANQERDQRKAAGLKALGWRVETVWECQVRDLRVLERLARALLQR